MRIGILTWHHVKNYGTAYQAFGLCKALEMLGAEVDLIDYRRGKVYHAHRVNYLKLLKSALHRKKTPVFYEFDDSLFNNYYDEHFSYSEECRYRQDFQKIDSNYDCFICGSDQVWNPNCFDSHFFLDFVEEKSRKIAYAPSFGVEKIFDLDLRNEMGRLISGFDFLSVREHSGCLLISEITGRNDVFSAIDPVFLLDGKEWEKISKQPKDFKQTKYGFIFFLANSPRIRECIEEMEKLGLEPVVYHCTQTLDNEYYNVKDLTPEEMLYILKNANYICTDSFHIMAFSIIFNRRFKVFKKHFGKKSNDQYGRITQLLDYFNLHEMEYEHNPVFNVFCSYEETNKKIEVRKAESFEYLKKALKNVDAKSKQNVYSICPYKQSVSDNCIGKTIDSIENNNTNNPFIEHINKVIRNNGICLMDKCYGCRRLRYNMGDYVFQCPLYINHLKKEIKEGKWLRVYLSYCLYYDLKKLIKKRNARG